MIAELPIHHYNPELTIEWLKANCPVQSGYEKLLKIDRSVIRKPHAEYAISVSLFDRDLDDHSGVAPNDPEHWRTKYYEPLLANISKLDMLNADVCVEVFVDPELYEFAANDITDHRVNFHVMRQPALGAAALFWRLLVPDVMENRECGSVVNLDIDLDWNFYFPILVNHSPVAVVLEQRGKDSLTVCPITGAKKYSPIGAGMFSYRISDVDFCMSEAIARFWNYCNVRLAVTESQTEFNKPLNRHNNGFGNTWNYYGNDERFLAKVFYYRLKRKGALNFLMRQEDMSDPLDAEIADMQFTMEHGGKVIGI